MNARCRAPLHVYRHVNSPTAEPDVTSALDSTASYGCAWMRIWPSSASNPSSKCLRSGRLANGLLHQPPELLHQSPCTYFAAATEGRHRQYKRQGARVYRQDPNHRRNKSAELERSRLKDLLKELAQLLVNRQAGAAPADLLQVCCRPARALSRWR
jgi:hypothetical protein